MIFLFILGILLVGVGVMVVLDGDKFLGIFSSVLGVLFLAFVTFVVTPHELPSGLPKTSIAVGEHKVAFIYVAGENVNMGIEEVSNENERLYLYQFSKSAFDSDSMNTQAKKLVVVESGNFRKLVLK